MNLQLRDRALTAVTNCYQLSVDLDTGIASLRNEAGKPLFEFPLDVQVRLTGETDTFNAVDSIKSGLESSPHFSAVNISSAKLDRKGKRVQFEIRMKRVN